MSNAPQGLHFDRPPLVETALAVEFAPIQGWGIQHYGLFWREVHDRFPRFQSQAPLIDPGKPLPPSTNPFGDYVRGWFVDESESRLIQLQYDRLIYNWRRMADGDEYPHYISVREGFTDVWTQFSRFLRDHGLEQPVVQRCNLTYVNNLPVDRWRDGIHLGPLATFNDPAAIQSLNISYAWPDGRESVSIVLQPVVRLIDAASFQQFQLTASMQPDSSNSVDIIAALDRGHERITHVFTTITTEGMQSQWLPRPPRPSA